ncbi:peptidoglycan DD-metalloendopeptidase family protein [Alkaliphilus pronyensis]|uniref:Peptidoglycan DD-metalloendopeptidase family protein n=1 Tax=Alkaliphilus pronyensis TaxID=1482732 RepID=A0A6I0FBR1_9FIRM|nr:M23 family metallopeptidase [Alkaliphilus pronyensis]KAB3539695.1 peptidoglycan DD-metalloendopeptidase family protein [Alkaliphilus pronyensis]
MSDKNHNNDNKKPKRSLYNILDKEGFYIILFLCVCIVAVTGIWVSNQDPDYMLTEEPPRLEEDPDITLVDEGESAIEESSEDTMDLNPEENTEEEGQQTASADGIQSSPATQAELEENQQENVDNDGFEEVMAVSSELRNNMLMPVIGRRGLPFASDKLVFHQTLEQWSTHKGLDIHAEEGAPVRAVLDGEVLEILNDTIMGITITLQHDGELLTKYSNLSTDALVEVGEIVEKGQIISGVGKTASTKTIEGPLLHFQVIDNGVNVDPEIYLPKSGN